MSYKQHTLGGGDAATNKRNHWRGAASNKGRVAHTSAVGFVAQIWAEAVLEALDWQHTVNQLLRDNA